MISSRKIVPLLLLTIVVLLCGRFVVFVSAMKSLKGEFRKTILLQEHKEIKELIVPADELYKDVAGVEWKENNKEVVLANKYHEVLSVKRQGNEYLVCIVEDDMENKLFGEFFKNEKSKRGFTDCLNFELQLNFETPVHGVFVPGEGPDCEYGQPSKQSLCDALPSRVPRPPRF